MERRQCKLDIFLIFHLKQVIVVAYICFISLLAWILPWPENTSHYVALRWMASGTRIADNLLVAPRTSTLEDRLIYLPKEHKSLIGKYLRKSVAAGQSVFPESAVDWPSFDVQDVVPVELDGEPNWLQMNAGSTVEIWVGEALKTPAARVVAILPAGKDRLSALLAKRDVKPDSLGTPSMKPALRILSFPRPGCG